MKYTAPEMNIIMFDAVDYIVASATTQKESANDEVIGGGED